MKKSGKGFSLMEVLVALFIIVAALGALATLYPGIFTGVNVDMQNLKAWSVAQHQMESLKNAAFNDLYAASYPPAGNPVSHAFSTGDSSVSGVYFVEQLRDKNNQLLTDIVKVRVVVCSRAGTRMLGEDANLNGTLDPGEDANGDNRLSSPLELLTLVLEH